MDLGITGHSIKIIIDLIITKGSPVLYAVRITKLKIAKI
jgi:hypothetical protein